MNIDISSVLTNIISILNFLFIHINYHNSKTTGKVGKSINKVNIINGFSASNNILFDVRNIINVFVDNQINICILICNEQRLVIIVEAKCVYTHIGESVYF